MTKMDVELEILQGRLKQGNKPAGLNRFGITLHRFVIGSDPICNMVCKSRTISRRHCLILIEDGTVFVRDLNSQAGTFINDVPVEGTEVLTHGDTLRVGRLAFRLIVTDSPAEPPSTPSSPPSVERPAEYSTDTVVGSDTVDASIDDLLQEADDAAREARLADPAARYFRADQVASSEQKVDESDNVSRSGRERPKTKSVGKLPAPPPIKTDDTVSAAEQALREIFQPSKGIKNR